MAKKISATTTLTFSDKASQAVFVTDPSKPTWDDYLTAVPSQPKSDDDSDERQEEPVKSR